jgi:hypothetical protein
VEAAGAVDLKDEAADSAERRLAARHENQSPVVKNDRI